MKAVVAQPLGRELVHRGRGNAATERAVLSEAAIIDKDQQNVRCAFWRLRGFWKLSGVGVEIRSTHLAGEMEIRSRQDVRCAGNGFALGSHDRFSPPGRFQKWRRSRSAGETACHDGIAIRGASIGRRSYETAEAETSLLWL